MRKQKLVIPGIIVGLAACGGGAQLFVGPDLFTYSATSQVTSTNPMRFSTTVTVTNGTADAISFVPACPIPRTLVYSTAARNGTPIWDSNTRVPAILCTVPSSVTLGAGKSVTYTLTATGAEALGASGTAGTYFLVDEVTLDGLSTRVNAGEVSLAR